MEDRKAKICVPVCVRHVDELQGAMERAAEVGDLVEVRLDCISADELEQRKGDLRELLLARTRSVILTLRPAEYGGGRSISLRDRLLFRIASPSGPTWDAFDFWDVEHDLALLLKQREREGWDQFQVGVCDWKRTIASYHDFVGVPVDIDSIFEDVESTSAAVLKVAVQADDATDCLRIFELLERARQKDRELIAIAMGQAGVMTRILGPSRGSFLTYGSLDEDSATAPGQITARELREVYRIDSIDQDTEVMGVIGRPVTHSISPHIHNAAFAAAGINAVFIPFEVNDLDGFVRRMVRESSREIDWKLRGLAVTAPHKTAVMKYLDWIEPAAKEMGAVNTVMMQDGALHGYNTDASGFIEPLKRRIGSLEGVQCAVIGAGGAARAVVWALRNERAKVTVFARNCDHAKSLIDDFGIDCRSLTGAMFDGFEVIVNGTPLGTRGESQTETPATAEQLREVRLAYDLVYNPIETRFLREARDAGCETIGGLEMLIGQAVEQFKLWTGVAPSQEAMRRAAIVALQK